MTGPIVLTVDGRRLTIAADPLDSLRAVLHESAEITSLNEVCGVGACGSCTVLLDGRSVLSCLTSVADAAGHDVTTIEGLPDDDPVVAAFVTERAFQCAMCTPGFVLATHDLLRIGVDPSDKAAIERGLAGNLCRCGSYGSITEAVRLALSTAASGGTVDG